MSHWQSPLLRLLTGLTVFLVAVVSLTAIPGLDQIGRDSIDKAIARLQLGREAAVEVTGAPMQIPDYMWDARIHDAQVVDLRPLIPSVATHLSGILDETAIRLCAGETGSTYELEISWDAASSDTRIGVILQDCLLRPIASSYNTAGSIEVVLPGGTYVLSLSADGRLGDDFELSAGVVRTDEPPWLQIPSVRGIPTIDIEMSGAMFQSWDAQRLGFSQAIQNPTDVVDTSNSKRVLADMVAEGGRSTAQLWPAGWGDPVHFSQDTPSFTGKILAGPLLFGMSRFKLYSIRSMCGLLDYVVASILADEGIFTRPSLLVRLSLNGRDLGLYLLEERSKSKGFFAAVQRYDGQVTHKGDVFASPSPPPGLAELEPIGVSEETSRGFAGRVNDVAFAKTLALLSRFQATHATQGRDFKLYRHPYLDSPEPLIRDLNVSLDESTMPGLLHHTVWWLGWHPIGMGAAFSPKTFPLDGPLSWSTETPYSFFFGSMHPAVNQFVSTPDNRWLFDQYLLYACDEAIQRRFVARMQSSFEAAAPFLSTDSIPVLPGGGQPYRGFDSELSWLRHQVDVVASGQPVVQRTVPYLLERSALLVDLAPSHSAPNAAPDTRVVSLYNLSPISARLRLPDYVQVADTAGVPNVDENTGIWHLSPSLLFPNVIPVSLDELSPELGPCPLTQDAARRILNLERLRRQSQSDPSAQLIPFVDVVVPGDRIDDFVSTLQAESLVRLGGVHALSPEKNILVNTLPEQLPIPPLEPSSAEAADTPAIIVLPLALEQAGSAHQLSLLISNISDQDVSLDLADLGWHGWVQPPAAGGAPGDSVDLRFEIRQVWLLGDEPRRVEGSRVTLGATSSTVAPSRQWLGSPMIWTGALEGLIDGPANESTPNCVLAKFDLKENGTRWIQTDASGLVSADSPGSIPRRVVVQEPYVVHLSLETPEMSPSSGYQGLPAAGSVSVNGYLDPHVGDFLIDGLEDEFWHVENPPESPVHWIEFDFAEPLTVDGLAILPRRGLPAQLWDEDHATLQGSHRPGSDADWVSLARLYVDKPSLDSKPWSWVRYPIPNTTAYRYYRILINDPSFLALAEVRFRTVEWGHGASDSASEPTLNREILEVGPETDVFLTMVRFKGGDQVIREMVTIPPGYRLELAPGTSLRFARDAGILSYGPIRAAGTAGEPIVLSPAHEDDGWRGVAVVGAAQPSEFRHVRMTGALGGSMGSAQFTGGLTFMNTSVMISDTELLHFASEDGLHLHRSFFEIARLGIDGSEFDALDSDWSYGTIANSTFTRSGGDGIDLCGSRADIIDSILKDNADKAISIGEGAVADIRGVALLANRTGIAIKDQSVVRLVDSEVTENDYGLLRYIKKPVYSYPHMVLDDNAFRDNGTNVHEEAPTSWTRRFD